MKKAMSGKTILLLILLLGVFAFWSTGQSNIGGGGGGKGGVPSTVPATSLRGTTTPASGAGIFQLAANTTAGSAGATICDDGNGNTTTTGCVTPFSAISGGTNTTAAMVVGSGSTFQIGASNTFQFGGGTFGIRWGGSNHGPYFADSSGLPYIFMGDGALCGGVGVAQIVFYGSGCGPSGMMLDMEPGLTGSGSDLISGFTLKGQSGPQNVTANVGNFTLSTAHDVTITSGQGAGFSSGSSTGSVAGNGGNINVTAGNGGQNTVASGTRGNGGKVIITSGSAGTGAASGGVNGYIDLVGHVSTSGTAPTVSSCGTSPSITGDDNGGTVTTGSGTVTACTLTFASAWTNTPYCVITDSLTSITPDISAISTTAVTFSFSATLTSGTIYYMCHGHV